MDGGIEMKVYVLEALYCDESSRILGVYTTIEKAEAAAKKYESSYSIRFTDITVHEVD